MYVNMEKLPKAMTFNFSGHNIKLILCCICIFSRTLCVITLQLILFICVFSFAVRRSCIFSAQEAITKPLQWSVAECIGKRDDAAIYNTFRAE